MGRLHGGTECWMSECSIKMLWEEKTTYTEYSHKFTAVQVSLVDIPVIFYLHFSKIKY